MIQDNDFSAGLLGVRCACALEVESQEALEDLLVGQVVGPAVGIEYGFV